MVAMIVVLASAWLFLKNRPRYNVEENRQGLTMQEYLEHQGEHVSFADAIRLDSPFRDIFNYIIIIDRVSFQAGKYHSDHEDDGIWCVGKLEEARCYIFTNRTPPQELRSFYQYIE